MSLINCSAQVSQMLWARAYFAKALAAGRDAKPFVLVGSVGLPPLRLNRQDNSRRLRPSC